MKLKSLRQECHKWIDLTNESRNWVCEWTIRCGRSSLVVILSDRSDQRCRYLRDDFIVQYPRYQKFPPRSLAISDTSKIPSERIHRSCVLPSANSNIDLSLSVLWLYRQMDSLRLTLDVCYPNNSRCRWYRGKKCYAIDIIDFSCSLDRSWEIRIEGQRILLDWYSVIRPKYVIYYCVCVYTHNITYKCNFLNSADECQVTKKNIRCEIFNLESQIILANERTCFRL